MSERSSVRRLRDEGRGLDIAAELKMPAAEASEKIGKARKLVNGFTYRFVTKDLPSSVGEAARVDFPTVMTPEALAEQLGIDLRVDKRSEKGSTRRALFGLIGQSPVVLLVSVGSEAGDFVDPEGRTEVWTRALASEISDAGQTLWPIIKYGNFGKQTYTVEPQVPDDQFFDFWGGPESMKAIAWDRGRHGRHPEAMRAFFSSFTQVLQFLEVLEVPAKGGRYFLPRDFAKGRGSAIWEEGRLRIRDLGLWQIASTKTPDLEITRRAYQWAAINQFLSSIMGKVFGTDLEFSLSKGSRTTSWSSRFRGKKSYFRSLSEAIGGGADLAGFVEEWNRRISPLVQRISQAPGQVGDESLPVVPGYSDLVFTGSPIELIRGVLKSHGLWFPRGVERVKDESLAVAPPDEETEKEKNLPRQGRGRIMGGEEAKMTATKEIRVVPEEAVEQLIVSEVLLLKTRADNMLVGFFANVQRRGHRWGDIVDMSNRVDLNNFIFYRDNLVPENWRKAVDQDRQQIVDKLIKLIDVLVGEESRARHLGHLQVFVSEYGDALHEIGKTDVENKFRLGHFLMLQDGGSTRGDKNCLLFACLASEYGNLALQEDNGLKRDVFLNRARFFHQASLFEGKSAGDLIFKAAVIAAEGAGAEAARGVAGEEARPEERVEVVLTAGERDLMTALENLVEMETHQTMALDAGDLQVRFTGMRTLFPKLLADGQLRAEVMKNVFVQLGAEGERMRKAGKKDEEIFEEWLKRVLIPLYRRARKK